MGSIPKDRHLDPPDDLEAPECPTCGGTGEIQYEHDFCSETLGCPHCGGTGYQPAPDFEPDFDPEYDTPPYEGP